MRRILLAVALVFALAPALKAGSGFYFYPSSTVVNGELAGIATSSEVQDIRLSTGAIQTSLTAVIASTGALALDDTAIKTSTGALASVDTAIKTSTGAIQTSLTAVIASTGALSAVDTLIKTSTGALALVDTAIKVSTGAEASARISGDSVLQAQISGIYLSTMSVFFYISTTVYNDSATYFSTTLTTATCITGSTITWTVGASDEIYVAGFSGTVTKASASAVYLSLFLDGAWLPPFTYLRWPITNNLAGTLPMTFYIPFSTSPGVHSICFPMWIATGTGSIAQRQVATFSLQRVK